MMILKTASGIASRCGSGVMLRIAAASTMPLVTVWLGKQLWGWAARASDVSPGPLMLAATVSLVCLLASIITIAFVWDTRGWTLEKMTGYAPFMIWNAMMADGRVTAWKLLLWPFLVPAEAMVCLWLAIGWLFRLLDVDLSKR